MDNLTEFLPLLGAIEGLLLGSIMIGIFVPVRSKIITSLMGLLLLFRPWIYLWGSELKAFSFRIENLLVLCCLAVIVVTWFLSSKLIQSSVHAQSFFLTGIGLLLGQLLPGFLIGLNTDSNKKFMVNEVLVIMMFIAVLGIDARSRLKVLIAELLGITLLGLSVIWNVLIGEARFAGVGGLYYLREGGILVDGWVTGPLMMIGVIAGVVLLFVFWSSKKWRSLLVLVLLINFVGLTLTGSRSSIMGAIGFVSVVLLFSPRKKFSLDKRFLVGVVSFVTVILIYRSVDADGFQRLLALTDARYYASSSYKYSTAVGRIDIFKSTLDLISRGNFLGYGIVSFEGDVGSSFAWFLYNTGLIGFFSWVIFLGAIAYRGFRLAYGGQPWLLGTFIATVLCSLSEVIWIDTMRGVYVLSMLALLYWSQFSQAEISRY